MEAHGFNLRTQEAEANKIVEFQVSLVYKGSYQASQGYVTRNCYTDTHASQIPIHTK